MDEDKTILDPKKNKPVLEDHLKLLKLSYMQNNFETLANQAVQKAWSHIDYLEALADGEAALRYDRSSRGESEAHGSRSLKPLSSSDGIGPRSSTGRQFRTSFA